MNNLVVLVLLFNLQGYNACNEDAWSQACDSNELTVALPDTDDEQLSLLQTRASTKASVDLEFDGGYGGEATFDSLHSKVLENPRESWWIWSKEGETAPPLKIKAYYVNTKQSQARASCMEEQLQRAHDKLGVMGITFEFERWPAVVFKNCQEVAECRMEKPECFPSGRWGEINHPTLNTTVDWVLLMRGVIGNYCSHLKAARQMEIEQRKWDYFMIFEDDTILAPGFEESLFKLLDRVPPSWTLAAFDTFSNGFVAPNVSKDLIKVPDVPVMNAISPLKGEYWGAQAWLLSAQRIHRFTEWFSQLPTLPLDWVPKAPRPRHFGFFSYNPSTALQRRLLREEDTWDLSDACKTETESDIRMEQIEEDDTRSIHSNLDSLSSGLQVSPNALPRQLYILGTYDAGTNFLHDLITRNLEEPNNVMLCQNNSGPAFCGAVWKHTHPDRIRELAFSEYVGRKESRGFDQAVAVVMVRHPFSFMRAMQWGVYDMDCGFLQSPNWLQQPCWYKEPESDDDDDDGEREDRLGKATCPPDHLSEGSPCWSSLVQAWNSYSYGYLHSLHGVFHKVIIARYEDVIDNPQPLLEQIAWSTQVPIPKQVMVGKDLLKHIDGEKEVNLTRTMIKLNSHDYESNYNVLDKKTICENVDSTLLFELGYQACQKKDVSFVRVKGEST